MVSSTEARVHSGLAGQLTSCPPLDTAAMANLPGARASKRDGSDVESGKGVGNRGPENGVRNRFALFVSNLEVVGAEVVGSAAKGVGEHKGVRNRIDNGSRHLIRFLLVVKLKMVGNGS